MTRSTQPASQRRRSREFARSRWAAIGAAVAVTLGAGGLVAVDAATPESAFVAIEPTRVLDTRIGAGLDGPFRSGVGRTLDVTGTIEVVLPGDRIASGAPIPDGATSLVANVTVTGPATGGFVSLRPGSATGVPATSTVNFGAGETVANAATVELPSSGRVQLFYQGQTSGSGAHVILDVVGYHVEGGAGPKGDTGERGLSAWDTIPSGVTVTGEVRWDGHASGEADVNDLVIQLPARAPVALVDDDMGFGTAGYSDTDPACTGTREVPTAPAGKLCVYENFDLRIDIATTEVVPALLADQGAIIRLRPASDASAGQEMFGYFTWAYTAP